MRESIEQLIDDYKRRVANAERIIDNPKTGPEQLWRVRGKRKAYQLIVNNLKEVLANDQT